MIRQTTCVEAHCDECDTGFSGFEDDNTTIHYTDADALERDLKASGWMVTGTRVLCPSCQKYLACALVGHDWQPWRPLAHLCLPGLMRSCNHCGTAQFDPLAEPSTTTPTRSAP